MNPKKRPIDKHTGQQYQWCACGRWIVHGTSHPTLTACNCGAWYKPHVARLNAEGGA